MTEELLEQIEITQQTNGADKAGAALGLAINNGGASTNAADGNLRFTQEATDTFAGIHHPQQAVGQPG